MWRDSLPVFHLHPLLTSHPRKTIKSSNCALSSNHNYSKRVEFRSDPTGVQVVWTRACHGRRVYRSSAIPCTVSRCITRPQSTPQVLNLHPPLQQLRRLTNMKNRWRLSGIVNLWIRRAGPINHNRYKLRPTTNMPKRTNLKLNSCLRKKIFSKTRSYNPSWKHPQASKLSKMLSIVFNRNKINPI